MYMHSHTDDVSKRESLISIKQKRLSHDSPALKFVHLLREKKCYSLYGATEQVDHQSCTPSAQQITIIASGNNTSIVIHQINYLGLNQRQHSLTLRIGLSEHSGASLS